MFPPRVPKLRMSGDATLSAAFTRSGSFPWRSFESTMSVRVVAAPIVVPSFAMRMPVSSLIVVRSMSTSGMGMPLPVTQSFMTPPTRSLPPPTTFTARSVFLRSRSIASWTVVASYSSKPLMAVLLLQRREELLAGEGHLGDPDTDRVVDRVRDGRRRRSHRGLAEAVRAERAVLLGLLDDHRVDGGDVLDAQRAVVEEVRVQRQAGGLVDEQLLGEDRPERHDDAALDLLADRERVDGPPDVVGGDVPEDLDAAGERVDLDLGRVGGPGGLLPGRRLPVLGLAVDHRGRLGLHDLREGQLLRRVALHEDDAVDEVEVRRRRR